MRKTGGCLCGAIRYQCDLNTDAILLCHCEQCRRQSGHVWASIHARGDTLEIDGRDALAWRRDRHTERGFCLRCGSFLFWRADGSPDVSVSAGSIDDASGLAIKADIFFSEKGAYYGRTPGAECYLGNRDAPPIAD